MQIASFLLRIVLPTVASLAVPCFSHYLIKGVILGKEFYLT